MAKVPNDSAREERLAALEAEVARLQAALALAGANVSDAARAASTHTHDMAASRADLAASDAVNAQLFSLNVRLQASEERLEAVVESATDSAIIEMDFDGRITGWSPGAERVLGWSAAEAIGQDGAIIWTPEDRAAGVPARERRAAEEFGSAVDERWHIRRDGTRVWGSGHLTPLRNGRPRGYLKVLRDRTAERRAEETNRASEARFRALATAGTSMLYRMSGDWRVMYQLDGRDILADTPEPIEDWADRYILPEDQAGVWEAIEDAIRRRALFKLEHRVRLADGRVGWFHSRAVPIFGPDEQIVEWFGAGTDVTARREAEGRQAFLLRLADALRPLTDPIEVQRTATRLLADHLGVVRVAYFEMEADEDRFAQVTGHEQDAVALPDPVRMSDYGTDIVAAYRSGGPVAVADVESDPRFAAQRQAYRAIGIRAWAGIPLVNEGRLVAILGVHAAEPRDWTANELQLLEEVAQRGWATVELARLRRRTADLHSFLIRFSEATRGLAEPHAVAETACRLLTEELGAERAYWAEVDWTTRDYVIGATFHLPDAPVVAGRFPLDDWEPFTSLQLAGRPSVLDDTQTDARVPPPMRDGFARIGVGADLAAPVIADGRLRCVLAVNQRLPRRWTPEDVALVQAVAGRCWAEVERARAAAATRASEARYRALFTSMDEAYAVVEVLRDADGAWNDFSFVEVNRAFMAHTSMPDPVGRTAKEVLGTPNPRWAQLYGQVLDTGLPLRVQEAEPTLGRVFDLNIFALDRAASRVAVLFTDITQRVRAEAALRESEARHRLLVENWAQATWETDADGVVVTDSPSWRRHTGQALEEWLGYGWLDAIHPDDRAFAGRQWREAVAAKGLVNAEFRLRAPDGGWRWTNVRAAPVLDSEGRVEKWVGMNIDIDAQKRAELALRESEERQAFLLKFSDALRAEPDMDAVANRAITMLRDHLRLDRCYITFYRPAEDEADFPYQVGNDTVPPLPPKVRLSDFPDAYEQVLERTFVIEDDFERRGLSDAERASSEALGMRAMLASTIRRGERNPLCSMAAVSSRPRRWSHAEIAVVEEAAERSWAAMERARTEAALRESETKYRSLFDTMGQGYCELDLIRDADGRAVDQLYLQLNPAFERLFGIPAAEAIGRRASEVFPGLEPSWHAAFEEVARTGTPARIEHQVASLGRWFEVFAYARGGDRLSVLYDEVTERKQAEITLQESEERQAFLLKLTDALRPLADPGEIQAAATRVLRERFDGGWCYYVEFDETGAVATVLRDSSRPGLPSLAGQHDVSADPEFLGSLRSGQVLNVPDYAGFELLSPRTRERYLALGFRSMVGTPLLKDGRCVAMLLLGDTRIRPWPDSAVALVQETAERTWAALERARAEAALRESEARFRGFAENSADVLWIANRDGTRLDYLSPAFERIFGEAPDRIMADTSRLLELLHPDDRAHVAGLMPRAASGETVIAHYRVIRPSDGRVMHLRDTGFPIRNAEGAIVRVAGVVQDVNDLQAAAEAREAETERFRALAEGLPELVWRSAAQGRWTWASPQWRDFTGLDEAGSCEAGWLAAVHPADRQSAMAAWEEAEAMGLYQVEFRLRHGGSGQYAWFQTRALPIRDPEGAVREWIGACSNIDDQVRAREALARSAEELERRVQERTAELMAAEETLRQSQKMEAIGQLTGGIAHDFNNMLQGVVGGLEMARRRHEQGRGEDAGQYMMAARDAAERAAGLTRRLLAFARKQRLEPKPVDADALISGMADLVRRTVGPAVEVHLTLCDGSWPVHCDASELEGAVLNLCINARDAMPEGGRLTLATEDVHLSATELRRDEEAPPGDYVAIRVEDTGTGIPPEVLDRVLEPFFTTKPQGQGTGLGLSQVWGFARQSGGVLRIASTPGEGTSVRILLPRAPAERPGTEVEALSSPVAGGGTGTVLLVDDEKAVRVPAAERLRDLGYRVVEAGDGPTTLRLLDGGLQPDLLVTDMGLPGGMNGRQVAEAARERVPGLPVLFITGYTGTAMPPGTEVIGKPFDLDALARRVRAHLASEEKGDAGGPSGP